MGAGVNTFPMAQHRDRQTQGMKKVKTEQRIRDHNGQAARSFSAIALWCISQMLESGWAEKHRL